MAMLEVKDLQVYYGVICALKGISFHVNEGEIVSLIGANGAGKTTTMQSVIGLLPKKAGSVTFNGTDITKMPCHKIVHAGMTQVPEGRRIFQELTVYENLMMGAYTNKDQQNDGADQGDHAHQQVPAALADVMHTTDGQGNAGNDHRHTQQAANKGNAAQSNAQQGIKQIAPPVFASGRAALEIQGIQEKQLDGLDKVNRLRTLPVIGMGLDLSKVIPDFLAGAVAGTGTVQGIAAAGAESGAVINGLAALGTEHIVSSFIPSPFHRDGTGGAFPDRSGLHGQ